MNDEFDVDIIDQGEIYPRNEVAKERGIRVNLRFGKKSGWDNAAYDPDASEESRYHKNNIVLGLIGKIIMNLLGWERKRK